MKIPNELPHFDKNPTCLAVITKFTAKFYFVHEGVLKQVSSIKQKEPDKFDEEVVLVPKGEGKTHGAVSFYESKEEELARKFSKMSLSSSRSATTIDSGTVSLPESRIR